MARPATQCVPRQRQIHPLGLSALCRRHRLNLRPPLAQGVLADLKVSQFLTQCQPLSGEDLDRFIADSEADGGPIVSTDENLYLEYATPKGNVMNHRESLYETLEMLKAYREPDAKARHGAPR